MEQDTSEAAYAHIDSLLDRQMLKHFEMAEMIGEYRNMLADLEEQRRPDPDMVRLARALPGARYSVNTTYVRETWLVIAAELRKLFPDDDAFTPGKDLEEPPPPAQT